MSAFISNAANAYANVSRLGGQAVKPEGEGDATGGTAAASGGGKPGFADLVGTAIEKAIATNYKSEAVSVQAIAGKAELHDVVTAVANAELTLNTVVAVRDKVIGAYQDILKMPI